jgi:uncharacterized membrane protein
VRLRIIAVWAALRSSYWFVPALMATGSLVLAYVFVSINNVLPKVTSDKLNWIYGGGAQGARSVLSTIAGSVITVAGTTFSITIAALSLASSQFGPRLLRTFRRDTGNQIVLGTFISTFLYCLLVLRTIVGTDNNSYVPNLAITFGVFLAILSLVVLIYFIHHTAASIQVENLMTSVQHEVIRTIENSMPEQGKLKNTEREQVPGSVPPVSADTATVKTQSSGYLLRVDYDALVKYASKQGCVVQVQMRPGNFSLPELTLATVSPAQCATDDLYGSFYFGHERTPDQDPEHALLELAEIAVRALSPGINDPFTAISCLDKLTDSMNLVSRRRMESPLLYDSDGNLRVVANRFTYENLVTAAYQFIRKAAAGNREVLECLYNRIELLLAMTDHPELRSALQHQLERTRHNIQQCEL